MSLSISAVERDTGLTKDTLRVWERRYRFPQPARDAFGERVYSVEQVDKLRALKRLMDRGMRPGKIIHHSLDDLLRLGRVVPEAADAAAEQPEIVELLALLRSHRVDDLRNALGQAVLRHGLAHFVTSLVAPLNTRVGEGWMTGELQVFEEHLYTEALQGVLRHAIAGLPRTAGSPRVLLTTLPQEEHGLGLLMAEALLTLDGAHCFSLGVQTPIADIVRAAAAQRADVVALSFSAAYQAARALDGLAQLRAALPAAVELWAGGSAAALVRRPPSGVCLLPDLDAIHNTLADWRIRQPAA